MADFSGSEISLPSNIGRTNYYSVSFSNHANEQPCTQEILWEFQRCLADLLNPIKWVRDRSYHIDQPTSQEKIYDLVSSYFWPTNKN